MFKKKIGARPTTPTLLLFWLPPLDSKLPLPSLVHLCRCCSVSV